ncbi:MAG: DUF192 domain-containing protein [Candidatus Thiodiazotropha sp.]
MRRILLKRDNNKKSTDSSTIQAWIADSYFTRLRGLLGKKQLSDNHGLLLEGCASVHTFGMRYPLDLVFLDKSGKVIKCQKGVKPFRTASARGAYYTLELNNGMICNQDISENDQYSWINKY